MLKVREIEYFIRSWTLIPASGGVFEVVVNGEVVFSKKTLKRHAEPGEAKAAIVKQMEAVMGAPIPPPQIDDD